MSTRAAIILQTEAGCVGIYCHSDGYTDGVGATLAAHYTHPAEVLRLVELGDISSLGDDTLDTVAYCRDRGEELHCSEGETPEEVAAQIDHNGYVYVFADSQWLLNGSPLTTQLHPKPTGA